MLNLFLDIQVVQSLPIYDELKNHSSIKHILVRHEQGAQDMQQKVMQDHQVSQV